ncbi:uncharacterized protein F5891DRAFT_370749 [Suillus fuscotomentosus]|uniref:Uncharacterized protein n=1 Tax=Suillus fuscotomentosus TaxID=1912939 RepID=A0AAD4EJS7_9AGAM|nr:uncharacterized protein F5891DRAFT_370749 [Suillus fuscotomentosus]KAG1907412.1 hypothetical protein F5891DRAFT_370749 [Suillus fuscotomentosus]
MATMQSNNRASLLNGLRTGGVRSTSMSGPHTAALGGSFNVPRFVSNQHSVFVEEEDDMDEIAELFSQNMYINNQTARPLTATVDGSNNRFVQQQMAAQSALNPNSVPFYPSYSQGMQPQNPSEVQLHAYQQMQMMQLEIARLQSEQAQRNARAQAILIQHALRQQMQSRCASATILSATAGPVETSFDIRPVGSPPARRPSQVELLKAQLGVQTPPLEEQVPMTAALGGRVGARVTSSVAFPSSPETPVRGSSPPGQTTVISGGTSLGNSLPSGNVYTIKDNTPSKSDVAVSWRRGSTTNSVLNGLRTVSAVSPSVKITPPPGERISPPPGNGTTSASKARPRPLSFTAPLSRTFPVIALDSGSEHEDAYSTSSSASLSNPTTPHSSSSLDTSPMSAREEAAKKLYEGLGMGRPILPASPVPIAHKFIGPLRQPRGPPSGADELGPKNFATRVRRKAIGGLGVLMGARERREAVEAY